MHLLCGNIELPFAAYNVKTYYFREQYPPLPIPMWGTAAHCWHDSAHSDLHQEPNCCEWRKLIRSTFFPRLYYTGSCLKWSLSLTCALYLFHGGTDPISAATLYSHMDVRARSVVALQCPSEVVSFKYKPCSGACKKILFYMGKTASKVKPTCYFITCLSLQKILR